MRRKDKFGKGLLPLPTNIESATPEYIRNNLPSWDAKIRARRAQRLRISPDEVANLDTKPLFMVEIEARVAAQSRRVDAADGEHLLQPTFSPQMEPNPEPRQDEAKPPCQDETKPPKPEKPFSSR